MRLGTLITSYLMASLFCAPLLGQQPLETVEVIGTTPLGAVLNADRIASNVQTATSEAIRERGALDLTDFMRRSFTNVFVNEAQNNPLQPDLRYRGFVGSPLLGLPQGIAVYQDAVRINEPFGDTVNWALIPLSAIDTVDLIPGSNPLFGLNALGGTISIRTKDGFTSQGSSAEIFGGSFSRIGVGTQLGGQVDDNLSYFLAGSYLEEEGWRNYSPTQAAQLFSKLSWRLDRTRLDASLSLADTDLIGNGASPVELLEIDRKAIFTRPDQTQNKLAQLNLEIDHKISEALSLTGNVYLRDSDIQTHNGDDSDYEECEYSPGLLCAGENGKEEILIDQSGAPIAENENVAGATVNRTDLEQHVAGIGLQLTWQTAVAEREHRFVTGLSYDKSDVGFTSSTELGRLDETRQAIPSGFLVDDSFTGLKTHSTTTALYLSDTISISGPFSLTLSGRYNRTEIELKDQLGTALNGQHTFGRFNPAMGLTYRFGQDKTFFASYSEANRVPSPVELTCADEDDPCRLPNAFLADPPLEQVVASTYEIGIRGSWAEGDWSVATFRTSNEDDIVFISAGALTNEGYFDNVGQTRRQGLELSISGQASERITWFSNYSFLDASFREHLAIPSPNNPAAIDGEISVKPGDKLPLIPDHLLKVGGRLELTGKLNVGGGISVNTGHYLRGDEGNLVEKTSSHAVLNARVEYHLSEATLLYLTVNNLFNEEYETFGLFGEADDVLGSNFEESRFLSPGAPRAAWLGLRVIF